MGEREAVRLVDVFEWDCPKCGRTNHAYPKPLNEPGAVQAARAELGDLVDPDEPIEFYMEPDVVQCGRCGEVCDVDSEDDDDVDDEFADVEWFDPINGSTRDDV